MFVITVSRIIPQSFVKRKENFMNFHFSIGPLLALIAGIVILFAPKLLNYIVAIYLIIIGILGLFGTNHISL